MSTEPEYVRRPRAETVEEAIDSICERMASEEFADLTRKQMDGQERLEYRLIIKRSKRGGYVVNFGARQIYRTFDIRNFIDLE